MSHKIRLTKILTVLVVTLKISLQTVARHHEKKKKPIETQSEKYVDPNGLPVRGAVWRCDRGWWWWWGGKKVERRGHVAPLGAVALSADKPVFDV